LGARFPLLRRINAGRCRVGIMAPGGKMTINHDRPNAHMRDAIDAIIRRLEDMNRHDAANELLRWGVPLPVIARVLHEPEKRRGIATT
jgi:hypothetical protein